jgi:HSP20 family protein
MQCIAGASQAFESSVRTVMVDFDEEFKDFQRRVERIFGDLFPQRILQMPGEAWTPSMDIYETEKDLVIIVEIAGAVPENLRLFYEGGILKIRGSRETLASCSHTKCHQMEIDFGSFQRQIHIPFEVDTERATSSYKHGLLRISLPKVSKGPRESIRISLK